MMKGTEKAVIAEALRQAMIFVRGVPTYPPDLLGRRALTVMDQLRQAMKLVQTLDNRKRKQRDQ